MAIDLQNPQNIATGWPAPQRLEAPSIGSLVSGILENRYRQQKLQQDSVAEAIKQYQGQRSDAAYIQAAQNAGVLPQGDYSNMTAAQASNLAQRIQDQQQTSQEKYYDALTKILTDTGRRPPTGPLTSGGQRPMTQGQQFNALKTQESLLGKQAGELEQQQQDYGLPADVPGGFGYMKNTDGTLRYAKTPAERIKPDLVSPTDILKGITTGKPKWTGAVDPDTGQPTMPTFTPDVYKQRQAQSAARQQILAEQARIQKQMLPPSVSQNDVDQANQQPPPSGTPPPQTSVTPLSPNQPDVPGTKIDPGTAGQYLVAAQGNRALAQRRAQADGWTW